MSYRIRYTVWLDFVGDGAGPMEVAGAQTKQLFGTQNPVPPSGPVSGVQIVPGGNSLTAANLQTALNNAATDIGNQVANNATLLGQLQSFSSGGTGAGGAGV